MLKRSDGWFEAASRPGFHAYALSFAEPLLAEVARMHDLPDPDELVRSERAIPCSAQLAGQLRARLRTIHDAASRRGTSLSPRHTRELRFDVPALLLTAFCPETPPASPPSRVRDRALHRALAYIDAHEGEVLHVSDLCRASGASERTLRYAFQERFGVSPKAYLHAVRLNGVRRELRRGGKVSDVANRWGFWHMGQFAADYRRLFGELPSQTLRSRARA